MRFQSQNSDLLVPKFMEAQIKQALRYYRDGEGLIMHRVTVFVTHKCNMFCSYCTGPHLTWRQGDSARKMTMLQRDLDPAQFRAHIQELLEHSAYIEHVHFTGGEASMKGKALRQMVETTSELETLSSITTNGLAKPGVYTSLVEAGLSEMRISIDSCEAESFDKNVKVKGAFERVKATIAEMVAMRQAGHDLFLVLNACVGEESLARIESTMAFLLEQDVNDLKLLAIVQDKQALGILREPARIARLKAMLDQEPPQRYWLLRRKVDRLFDPDASGLMDEDAQRYMKRCFIPMTERTIDGQHYYPCSIYTRWYGEPLGDLSEPFEEQQRKTMEFVEGHDCRHDPICRRYCVNCCKIYNILMNLALAAQSAEIETGQVLDMRDRQLDSAHLQAAGQLLRQAKALEPAQADPFLIIKPHGMDWLDECLECIEQEHGLTITARASIADWTTLAALLYTREDSAQALQEAMRTSAAFALCQPRQDALLLWFDDAIDPDVLQRIKYKLRARFPSRAYTLRDETGERRILSSVVHVPDDVDRAREAARIERFLGVRHGAAVIDA